MPDAVPHSGRGRGPMSAREFQSKKLPNFKLLHQREKARLAKFKVRPRGGPPLVCAMDRGSQPPPATGRQPCRLPPATCRLPPAAAAAPVAKE